VSVLYKDPDHTAQ